MLATEPRPLQAHFSTHYKIVYIIDIVIYQPSVESRAASTTMASDKFFQHLRNELSKKSQVLTDQHHSDFKASLERWSNLDLQVPAAIVKPASEEDVVLTVRY